MGALADGIDLLASPLAQASSLRERRHRPWPLPRRPWVMGRTWVDLLFAHWGVAPSSLAQAVPGPFSLDTFDGRAWIGVTPLRLRNLLPLTLPLPILSSFPEINVRTYVTVGGKPGVLFFSLDAGSAAAVAAGRRLWRLPYFRARMSMQRDGTQVSFTSQRADRRAPAPAEFRGRYRPAGPVFRASPGSLEHWLTERYCLYAVDGRGRVRRAQVHHAPWPLQPAEADIEADTMLAEIGLVPAGEPLLHYARRVDVLIWGLEKA